MPAMPPDDDSAPPPAARLMLDRAGAAWLEPVRSRLARQHDRRLLPHGILLTGIVAALRARRDSAFDAEEAASAAVCLHAAAGDRAAWAGEKGMIAGDILECLRAVANGLGDEAGARWIS